MSDLAEGAISPDQHYADGLKAGRLMFQRCEQCAHTWMPARSECPNCLASDFAWAEASGDATLVSWVVYHRAFSSIFKDRVPYIVVIAKLAEGPRLISNVDYDDVLGLEVDKAIKLRIDHENDRFIPRFRVV